MKKLVLVSMFASVMMLSFMPKVVAEETSSNNSAQVETIEQQVNLNKADLKQLQSLPGIGKKKAEAIIEYREENGDFLSVEELVYVKGIGKKVMKKLSGKVVI